MKNPWKLLLEEVKQENKWGYNDKDEIKLGKVAFDFKGKTDDVDFDLKKGQEVYYQYGTRAILNGKELILVSLTSLICLKQ